MTVAKQKDRFRPHDRNKALYERTGFTLVELMIVLSVFAILMSVAVPVLNNYISRHRFSGAAMDVLGNLRRARAAAVEKNRSVVFRVIVATGTYQAFVDDGAGSGDVDSNGVPDNAGNNTKDGDEEVIVSGTLPRGVSFSAANFGGNNNFRFDNRGFPFNNANVLTGGTIDLVSDLGAVRRITLVTSGHTRIQ
ncbi:MAG: prepilin-type N-terminal cleavage/methylation domain-containing protein [Desulfobacteraceae bacterium]|nr:MAG: prepilin-type N-terminal cleavage/methylation domain-containing protein [Desulfobacteraceae bacterium]